MVLSTVPITEAALPRWISILSRCRKNSKALGFPVACFTRLPTSLRNALAPAPHCFKTYWLNNKLLFKGCILTLLSGFRRICCRSSYLRRCSYVRLGQRVHDGDIPYKGFSESPGEDGQAVRSLAVTTVQPDGFQNGRYVC